jgi:predicted RNA-binding Zn-ribbon protein involved in translation (DUF1610 family)
MTRARGGRPAVLYGQLWLVFDWPQPRDRVPATCLSCPWRGRRVRRTLAARPCPRCGAAVRRHLATAGQP